MTCPPPILDVQLAAEQHQHAVAGVAGIPYDLAIGKGAPLAKLQHFQRFFFAEVAEDLQFLYYFDQLEFSTICH